MESGRPAVKPEAILLGLIATVTAGYALRALQLVLMPLFLAAFMVMLVYPVRRAVHRRSGGKAQWLATAIPVLLLLAAAAAMGGAVWLSVQTLSESSGEFARHLEGVWEYIDRVTRHYNVNVRKDTLQAGVGNALLGIASIGVASAWETAAVLVLIFFMVLLGLLETDEWCRKIVSAFPGGRGQDILGVIEHISRRVRRYFFIQTVISVMTGVVTGLWLWVLGVDFAFVWAFVTVLLNYVPYAGSIVAVFPPSLTALSQGGPGFGLLTLGGLTVIQQVIGNYIDPRMQGQALTISPLVLLLAIVFWAWVWGVAGAVLAVPLTITGIAVCERVPLLAPFAMLLSRDAGDT